MASSKRSVVAELEEDLVMVVKGRVELIGRGRDYP